MNYNKVKYWKSIKSNLNLHDALNMLKSQAIEGILYDCLAIRLGYKIILPNVKVNELLFSVNEWENENWEVIIPDDGKEELLYKVREMVKDENFLKVSHDKIDNMNIADIWNAIDDIITISDDQVKYRLIKNIVENKLYKKA